MHHENIMIIVAYPGFTMAISPVQFVSISENLSISFEIINSLRSEASNL